MQVGVGVAVLKNDLVLIGKRINSHGAHTWSFPGGHVDFGENPSETGRREVLEETGVHVTNIQPLAFTSDVFANEKLHYITLFYTASWSRGDAVVLEPGKCLEWIWAPYENLPEPLFLPLVNLKKLFSALPGR